ncbi:MAG: DUF1109 domain-containing protein [Sulfuritalea sp.]|nr:DUF1109 domain-containing protein [Sulfuritalea sp.]
MKTDRLIGMLATGVALEHRVDPWRGMSVAIGFGALCSTLLMLKLIPLNPDLDKILLVPGFLQKLGFSAAIAVVSLMVVIRLSRPGASLGSLWQALSLPVVAMWLLAAAVMFAADPDARASLFFGKTWKVCPLLIAMLSAPVFVGTFWAMRELAPTRLRLSGAGAGLFAGATGAVVYCFHCPELDAPFIAFWYLLGMLIPAFIGALLGPRLLRW